ncbi:MAG: type II CRISPR-associated endonuclease Cas1 [Clostridia bacterium]
MTWRTVVIHNKAKLEFRLNHLLVRGEEEKLIHLSEVGTIIIESTAVSLTCALLSELSKRKIKVIFCDEKYNPESELVPYYGSHNCSGQLKHQICWADEKKAICMQSILKQKIISQAKFVEEICQEKANYLFQLADTVEKNDITNREGMAAKYYFNSIFGDEFSRSGKKGDINSALNYGYAILLSSFNREIVGNGYNTCLGLKHCNEFNYFNLSSDLIEPFRVEFDKTVFEKQGNVFDCNFKMAIVDTLNRKVKFDGQSMFLVNAIKLYVKSVFDFLNEEDTSIKFLET